MSVLNLNQAQKLYFGNTEAQKLYRGDQLLYPTIVSDPFLNQVLLHLKGDNFTDSSPNPKTVNTSASSAISTAFKKYGSGSLNFTVENSVVAIPNLAGVTNFNNLTIEFWAYFTNTSDKGILQFSNLTNSWTNTFIRLFSHTRVNYWNNTSIIISRSIPINQWVHIAFVHNGNNLTIYVDGVSVWTGIRTNPNLNTAHNLNVGAYYNGTGSLMYTARGYFDSFKITNAVRYTQNFNPETDTFLAY